MDEHSGLPSAADVVHTGRELFPATTESLSRQVVEPPHPIAIVQFGILIGTGKFSRDKGIQYHTESYLLRRVLNVTTNNDMRVRQAPFLELDHSDFVRKFCRGNINIFRRRQGHRIRSGPEGAWFRPQRVRRHGYPERWPRPGILLWKKSAHTFAEDSGTRRL
jgi:hypothetical protein